MDVALGGFGVANSESKGRCAASQVVWGRSGGGPVVVWGRALGMHEEAWSETGGFPPGSPGWSGSAMGVPRKRYGGRDGVAKQVRGDKPPTPNVEARTPETRPPRWSEARATGSRAGFSSRCRPAAGRACRSSLYAHDLAHLIQQFQLRVGDNQVGNPLSPTGRFPGLTFLMRLHILRWAKSYGQNY